MMSWLKQPVIAVIRFYRYFISPLYPPACRFEPTCSAYTIEAVETHGVIRGVWLGAKRIVKCRPGQPGGFDPVPNSLNKTESN